jgi:hypothetical protein
MRSYQPRSSFPFYPREYFSHILILVSVVIAIAGFTLPGFKDLFGFHRVYLDGEGIVNLI